MEEAMEMVRKMKDLIGDRDAVMIHLCDRMLDRMKVLSGANMEDYE
ncbi:MAG: hypothetical protein K6G34_11135 [Lachnospiraceae bacterium]|nr:hypothetical protein [Lachnospiraceae bacterium]